MQKIIYLLLSSLFPFVFPLQASSSVDKDHLVIERVETEVDLFSLYRQAVSDHSQGDREVMELYDHLEQLLRAETHWSPDFNAELVLQGVAYAAEMHEGQKRRYSEVPYISHSISVVLILFEEGNVKDHFVLTAAALHDTLEDTDASAEEIAYLFSDKVKSLVQEVTNDPNLTYEMKHAWQIKHALKMSPEAKLIKLADRTHNLRSYNEQDFPEGSRQEDQKRNYFMASANLAKALSGCNEKLDIAIDEEIHSYLK